ncbi:MAG: hypothetical protein LAP85_19200 [Acidobacteriia bacterium]|nr:hypothetical protein [Terriglobia bacterium]
MPDQLPEVDHAARASWRSAFPAMVYMSSPQDLDLPTVIAPDAEPHLIVAGQSGNARGTFSNRVGINRSFQPRNQLATQNFADLVLNSSFKSLFTSVFNRRDGALTRDTQAAKEDLPNPFIEARKNSEIEKAEPAAPAAAATAQQSSAPKETNQSSSSQSRQAQDIVGGMLGFHEERFTFLGDFDGSGILQSAYAKRVGVAAFSFGETERTFVIFDNQAAVENQRSFAMEDLDGNGTMDLVQTSRASLFGAVFHGDGSGNFQYNPYTGYFLTGYEPTVTVPGPMGEGGREILSVNLRTGSYTAFRPHGAYWPYRQGSLSFVPDCVAHLVDLGSGMDYLWAARRGNASYAYPWPGGGSLPAASEVLPADTSISISGNPQLDEGMGALQVYQIGSYASVVLTNSQGQAFNVANLRVTPQIFLVFGNIEKRGTLDVGIAYLLSATPSK